MRLHSSSGYALAGNSLLQSARRAATVRHRIVDSPSGYSQSRNALTYSRYVSDRMPAVGLASDPSASESEGARPPLRDSEAAAAPATHPLCTRARYRLSFDSLSTDLRDKMKNRRALTLNLGRTRRPAGTF